PPLRRSRRRHRPAHRPAPGRGRAVGRHADQRHRQHLPRPARPRGRRRAPRAHAQLLAQGGRMKFSLFFEMQIESPTREKEAQTFRDCVLQAVLADELGYHAVWEVEHHGLYEYSHSSAPEVFLAFVAARTNKIRLGHGVTLLPHRYNHPIRIAERLAVLDILSGGRVNWGSGKSSSLVEQHAFETDIKTLHDQWLEAVEMIPRMWSSDVFSHEG